ncbi:2-acyl-glycerophospho-ethanolamine acyltransferase [Planctomycetes bacterium Pla163]|uniref:2-acyl-glycerophospho-ethanolamine acyltransferase n=1 Tax=Rohdeia mirabilis TaxID=2528008 RepID=A0A518CW39_9BACT|nr:2-acyl-glycerophospho-ethanolamine acyltransferase [Planctomycetes bacterium Pla163]
MKTLCWLLVPLRLATLFVVTFALWCWYAAGRLIRPAAADRAHWRNRMIRVWGRASLPIMGVSVRVEGTPPVGCLLVCNHLGYLDIPVLASQVPTIFVSKAEVAHWPLVGALARSAGTVFVQREQKRTLVETSKHIAEELELGSSVVLFPEGTSSGGEQVLPFRASLLDPAARGGLPVAYAALRYLSPPGFPPASDVVCWWRDMPFGSHILGLLRLPRIRAEITFGAEPLVGRDRKDLAQRLWEATRAHFKPSV